MVIIITSQRKAETFHCKLENVWQLTNDIIQLAVLPYFALENIKKHSFFEIFSPKAIVLVLSFLRMKSSDV